MKVFREVTFHAHWIQSPKAFAMKDFREVAFHAHELHFTKILLHTVTVDMMMILYIYKINLNKCLNFNLVFESIVI